MKLPALLLAAASLATPAFAQNHAAHTHGLATLDIAIERDAMMFHLETPQDNLVGFERPPRSAAEREAAAGALATLKAADRWLQVDPQAGCRITDVEVDAPALGEGPAPAADGGHADVDTSVTMRCTDAARAGWVDVGLATAFPRLRRLTVQIAGPQGQSKRMLERGQRRVLLSR